MEVKRFQSAYFNHGDKESKKSWFKEEYFNHLYLLFKPLVSMNPSLLERKPDRRTGLVYKSLYFWTLRFPCLNEYYEIFYKDKVKIIPKNLDKLLTPISLAYWIMDDGSKSSYGQTVLHTRSFTMFSIYRVY